MLPGVRKAQIRILPALGLLSGFLAFAAIGSSSQAPPQSQQSPSTSQAPPAQPSGTQQSAASGISAVAAAVPQQHGAGLNVVVLDPAHGGTDPGARGRGGVRESDIVLEFAFEIRHALELQGFQVVQTRQGNENPSFDDRSAMANGQHGAVFVTLHVSSTGLPGSVRVYVNSDLPGVAEGNGLIPWDRAQAPFLGLSRKLGDQVQALLAQRFKGSPETSQTANVRQLRTTASPAIAVEISSVTVEDRADLDRMAPGVADAIARGVAAFKPTYLVSAAPGGQP